MRAVRTWFVLPTLALSVACDLPIPTQLPKYDTEWSIQGQSTTISVNALLPSGVTTTADRSAFQVDVSPATVTFPSRLGDDCAECAPLDGQVLPKPQFVADIGSTIALPAQLSKATLVRDTLLVTIGNGLNFDPLRPSISGHGHIVILVMNESTLVGRDSVDGSATSLAPDDSIVRRIPLRGTITGANGLHVSAKVNSPVGDPVKLDASRVVTVTGRIGALFVSSAQVELPDRPIVTPPSVLDLSKVGQTISSRVHGGSLVLTVDNPLNVTGNLSVSFSGGAFPIVKPFTLSNRTSISRLTFTKEEMQALLGSTITTQFRGTIAGSGVDVEPGQVVSVSSRLQVTLSVGDNQ
jgi:hypothetical protein